MAVDFMAKLAPSKKTTSKIELEPDAWSRFERAVDVVAKSPPQHRKKKEKRRKPTKAEKKRND
jgi:hypothetical protein